MHLPSAANPKPALNGIALPRLVYPVRAVEDSGLMPRRNRGSAIRHLELN